MNNRSGTNYRVLFRKKDHAREEVMNYIGYDNWQELVKYLDAKETLNTETCNVLIVHEHRSDGTIVETYTYDPEGLAGKPQAKPRVKLSSTAVTEQPKEMLALPKPVTRFVAMGRYPVREATAYE